MVRYLLISKFWVLEELKLSKIVVKVGADVVCIPAVVGADIIIVSATIFKMVDVIRMAKEIIITIDLLKEEKKASASLDERTRKPLQEATTSNVTEVM